jgi:hypothetical protein
MKALAEEEEEEEEEKGGNRERTIWHRGEDGVEVGGGARCWAPA